MDAFLLFLCIALLWATWHRKLPVGPLFDASPPSDLVYCPPLIVLRFIFNMWVVEGKLSFLLSKRMRDRNTFTTSLHMYVT
jgi:hypothetical protein